MPGLATIHDNFPKEGTDVAPGVHVTVPVTLLAQLQSLGVAPKDVNFVAFSHLHWDHTGNANEFPDSVWIMNKAELAASLILPPPGGVLPETWSAYKNAKNETIDGDYDVFGDGKVMILRAPGHTPGHQVLKLQAAKKRHRHSFGRPLSFARRSDSSSGYRSITRIAPTHWPP